MAMIDRDELLKHEVIRDMDDEEMARKLVPAVLALCDDGAPSEDTVRDWLERPQSNLKV